MEFEFEKIEAAWWKWVNENCPHATPRARGRWMTSNTFTYNGTTWKREIVAGDGVDRIDEKLQVAIAEKLNELLPADGDAKGGRLNEQRTDLRWALESILAHIERGMTVEIRLGPPPPPVAEDADDNAKNRSQDVRWPSTASATAHISGT